MKNKKSSPLYLGGLLAADSAALLGQHADPSHPNQYTHHVTLVFGCSPIHAAAFAGMEWRAEVKVILNSGDVRVARLGEVEVLLGTTWVEIREGLDDLSDETGKGRKGQEFHVTLSTGQGVKPQKSNEVIASFDDWDTPEEDKGIECIFDLVGETVGGTIHWVTGGGQAYTCLDNLKGFDPEGDKGTDLLTDEVIGNMFLNRYNNGYKWVDSQIGRVGRIYLMGSTPKELDGGVGHVDLGITGDGSVFTMVLKPGETFGSELAIVKNRIGGISQSTSLTYTKRENVFPEKRPVVREGIGESLFISCEVRMIAQPGMVWVETTMDYDRCDLVRYLTLCL